MRDLFGPFVAFRPRSRPPMSEHLRLEIAAAAVRRSPLELGEPVPGCRCERCTGLPADHPARLPAWRRLKPEEAARSDHEHREAQMRRVGAARRISIVEVTARLGCGDPVRRGKELAVRCPLHADEDPSCRVDPVAGVWFCDPCGEGGDGIDLWMRARRVPFTEAAKELAG